MVENELGQRAHTLPQLPWFWWVGSGKVKNFGFCVAVGLFHLRGFN
jgi:hypothetical protein